MRQTVGPELHFMSAAHTSTTLSARPCLPRACGPAVEQALRRCDRKNYVDADIPHAYIYQVCVQLLPCGTSDRLRQGSQHRLTRACACLTLLPHCCLQSVLPSTGFAPAHWLPRDHLCSAHARQAAVGANASCRCCCCCCCRRRRRWCHRAAAVAAQRTPHYSLSFATSAYIPRSNLPGAAARAPQARSAGARRGIRCTHRAAAAADAYVCLPALPLPPCVHCCCTRG